MAKIPFRIGLEMFFSMVIFDLDYETWNTATE